MAKPDDRSDNAEKIQENIDSTLYNIELAEDMIENTSDNKTKKDLTAKNERRKTAIPEMEQELKDELAFKK